MEQQRIYRWGQGEWAILYDYGRNTLTDKVIKVTRGSVQI